MLIIFIILILVLVFFLYSYIPANIYKKKFFSKDKSNKKVIYLTFDDGPSEYTDELLDLLNRYKVKASFFCVANFAKNHSDVIERLKAEGHTIALHSLKHKNSMLQGIVETKRDLETSLKIMEELGVQVKYYRPPWGDCNLYLHKKLEDKGLKFILWNVMSEDWEANTTENIIARKLLDRVRAGDIICLHDGRGKNEAPAKTINALKIVIPEFLKKGYEFKTIDEYED